jgi:CDGSH-type Zn-finger protein/uncharacterized Fe-S cluster protein YjdI
MSGDPIIEPKIRANNREELLYLLAEAAEIEHNLMCCYLYAAFALKTPADGLSAELASELSSWRSAIIGVASEERTHLALVTDLTLSIGGTPHFGRPNFPVAARYHPSGVVVELHPLDRATLDHFIYLERPEGIELADGEGFTVAVSGYRRDTHGLMMPSAQDYLTVGHLYRGIRAAFEHLSLTFGERPLFVGDPRLQVGQDLISLPGLIAVNDTTSALAALSTIIAQGEGSPADVEHSHYRRFLTMRQSYDRLLRDNPDFTASRRVARNPVMRRPPFPEGKVYVDHPGAAAVMDLANSIYGALLRGLAQGFTAVDAPRKKELLEASIATMGALSPVAEHLTTSPASLSAAGVTAGISFAMLRDIAPFPSEHEATKVIAERFVELAGGSQQVLAASAIEAQVTQALQSIGARLSAVAAAETSAPATANNLSAAAPTKEQAAASPEIELAEGRSVILEFHTKRCIRARFCVLQQPDAFKANVVGPWLAPDDATSAEALVAVAQNCPSGAIQYRRKDGKPNESAPPVNLIQIRENGPLAVRADIAIDGAPFGFRSTLCRCGASQNKPFCEGSHRHRFAATGEPATGGVKPSARRAGRLDIRPQRNGPLVVSGNADLISGTGRTVLRAMALALCRCGASANNPSVTVATPGPIL